MRRQDNPELKQKVLDYLASLYKIKEVRESNHLSSYITCRTKSFLDSKGTAEPTNEEVMLFALGYGLQDVLTPKDVVPVVYNKEGIIYRPDLPMTWTGNLGEIKTTRKSAKYHFMEDALPVTWLDYMMGGCHMTDTNKYDLVILYMMGNYGPPFPDIYAETDYFEAEEIEANWQKIIRQKEVLDSSLVSGIPPEPFKNCYSWESKYCRYNLICQSIARTTEVKMNEEQLEEDKKLWV